MISLSVKSPLLQNISSVAQLCLTLCDPMGCSMPGFPVHHQTYLTLQTYFDPQTKRGEFQIVSWGGILDGQSFPVTQSAAQY